LHGEELGSVDREHHLPGSPLIEADCWLWKAQSVSVRFGM
jgi:hypothetical protein